MANSALAVRILPETERTLAFGGISGAFAAVGTPLAHAAAVLIFTNATDAPMSFSWDGTNAHTTLMAMTSFVLDIESNKGLGGVFLAAQGTQFYVKQVSAPTSGSVYVDVFYGANFNNL